jgi:hypothetical protein
MNNFDNTLRITILLQSISDRLDCITKKLKTFKDCSQEELDELFYLNTLSEILCRYSGNEVRAIASFNVSKLTEDILSTGFPGFGVSINGVPQGMVDIIDLDSNDLDDILDALVDSINNATPVSGLNYTAFKVENKIFLIAEEGDTSVNGHVLTIDGPVSPTGILHFYNVRDVDFGASPISLEANCLTETDVKVLWNKLQSKFGLCLPEYGQLPQNLENPTDEELPESLTCGLLLETENDRLLEDGFRHKLEECSNIEEFDDFNIILNYGR